MKTLVETLVCSKCRKKAPKQTSRLSKEGSWIGECCWTMDCLQEIWAVHTICSGNGRAIFGLATGKKAANHLGKHFRAKIWGDDDFDSDDFVISIKKVKKLDDIVMDLT